MHTQVDHRAPRWRPVVVVGVLVLGAGVLAWVRGNDRAVANTSPARRVYRVPSGSMLPTLHLGQRVMVDLRAYRRAAPQLDDIVVFHPAHGADLGDSVCGNRHEGGGYQQPCGVPTRRASTQTYIKRIVGLPGDRIALVNGRVIRNGRWRREPYILACPTIPECTYPKSVVIPRGDYFMLGDNRGESNDSRFWGPVPRSWILGKVLAR
jgi:signal peptidase I